MSGLGRAFIRRPPISGKIRKRRFQRRREMFLRGKRAEKIVFLALQELKKEGMVSNFRMAKRNGREDCAGIDCVITIPQSIPPGFPERLLKIQIKSSEKYAEAFKQNHSNILVLVVRPDKGKSTTELKDIAKKKIIQTIICKRNL